MLLIPPVQPKQTRGMMATTTLSKNVNSLKIVVPIVVPIAMKLPRGVLPCAHNKHERRWLSRGREECRGL